MKTYLRALVLLLTIICTHSSMAQLNRLFTTEQGLSTSLVNEVAEDSDDFIWIATEDGLCRFDGSHIKVYKHNPQDSCSLAGDFVRTLSADNKGHLLIGTVMGVQMYRPETDDFTPLIVNPSIGVFPGGNCQDLTLLLNGDFIVVGNATFTIHIDENNVPHAISNAFTGSVEMTHKVTQDLAGNIWVNKQNEDLYRLDTYGNLETIRPHGKPLHFQTLGRGPDGSLYASGMNRGIYKYNIQTGDFDEVTHPGEDYSVRDFSLIHGTRQMYIGTDGEGVKLLDCVSGKITPFVFDDQYLDAETQKVHNIERSRNGEIWMALYQKGVFVMPRNPLNFRYYGPKSVRYNCIGSHCVTSLLRSHDGNLWVTTDNGGLYSIDAAGNQLAHFPITSHPTSVPSSMTTLFEDSRHRIWIGSYHQGGGWVDLKTGRCTYLPFEGLQGTEPNIYGYVEDKRGQIWVATMGNGLARFDEQRQSFVPVETVTSCIWSCSMHYNAVTDRLYVGTYSGIVTIDLSTAEPTIVEDIPSTIIFSITPCSDTQLSLCTNVGLMIYNWQDRTYRLYTTEDGLPNNNVYASQIDGDGGLWISSNNGLSKFNMQQGTFTNYTLKDGLQANEYYKNASMHDADGTLWFGGMDGITWFNPRDIQGSMQQAEVRVVDFRADQTSIYPDHTGVYRVSEDEHSFSISLATRPIMLTSRVSYRYSMDGDRWITLPPSLNTVSFSHISSGSHQFSFQAVSDAGESDIETILINIAHPWYRSGWAIFVWMIMLFALFYLIVSQTIRKRRERALLREQQQQTAINEAKLSFFMNIAHEFRTPMTLIVSPLQKLMASDRDVNHQRSYQIIDRNVNRILKLINELMDLRKIDKEQMKLACHKMPLVPVLTEMSTSVSDLAESRHIRLSQHFNLPADLVLWLDPKQFETILINLLSNSLKYTPEGGSVDVSSWRNDPTDAFPEGSVSVAVTDTGVGIPAEERSHIFDRFYQVRNNFKNSVGTGIGLNLVHSLVLLHHGHIVVSDNPEGRGTRFVVTLPLGDSLYSADEKLETPYVAQEGFHQGPSQVEIASSLLREEQTTPLPEVKPGQAKQHIVLVDDDDEIRNYLTQELSPYYKVTQFPDGQPALEYLLRGERVDLVLSDVMMPGMDGLQLCVKVRGNVRLNHIPIILLTALSSDEDRLRSLEIGANAFISKPFNIEILMRTVVNILEQQARLRNTFSGHQLPVNQVETPEVKSPDERLMERILKVVNDNLSNPDLTSEMIAKEVGLSRVHLYRKLKELTNQSARNYFRNIRLAKAAELLSQKKMAVAEVAYHVGFSNPNNFATAFKELYGISPTAYMEQQAAARKEDE